MFGALNRFIGRLDSEPARQASSQNLPDSTSGFQILKNTNPDLPLEPWFDFIIGINGHFLVCSREPANWHKLTEAGIFRPSPVLPPRFTTARGVYCSLDLWSAKVGGLENEYLQLLTLQTGPEGTLLDHRNTSTFRTPWADTSACPLEFNLQHLAYLDDPFSTVPPPHVAGLLPHSDYILGSPSGTLRGESAFGELVEDHLNRSLVLWVYNSEFDVVREVELIPRRGWGGDGALGAVLGFGALHRLPVGLSDEVQAPGEKLF